MAYVLKVKAQDTVWCYELTITTKTFLTYVNLLGSTVEDICFQTMTNEVEKAVSVNEGSRDTPIAVDGTWQKRGYKSLNGIVTATSFDTGKVVDMSILSKYCACPDKRVLAIMYCQLQRMQWRHGNSRCCRNI